MLGWFSDGLLFARLADNADIDRFKPFMSDQIAEKRSISSIRPDTTNSSSGKIIVSGTA